MPGRRDGRGADSIDDMDLLRHGAMRCCSGPPGAVHPGIVPAVVHLGQRAAGQGAPGIPGGTGPLQPAAARGRTHLTFTGIDSQQKRVCGHAKQGAAFGFTKIQGKGLLVRGLNVLAATICTPLAAPVIAGTRLRGGNASSARGAASGGHRAGDHRPRGRDASARWWCRWIPRSTVLRPVTVACKSRSAFLRHRAHGPRRSRSDRQATC